MIAFKDYVSCDLVNMAKHFEKEGLKVCLVGGVVRDYYLNRKCSGDYDVEIRCLDEREDLQARFSKVITHLKKKYEVQQLRYQVFRIKLNETEELELTLPRLETFNGTNGHSNFSVEFINDPNYATLKRRDFTINAMVMKYCAGDWMFVDPLNGSADIANKMLRPCSNDFKRDPVRLLRAIRFSLSLNFKISPEIEAIFSLYSIEESYSSHYVKTEMFKSKQPMAFIDRLFSAYNQNIQEDKFFNVLLNEEKKGNSIRPEDLSSLFGFSKLLQGKIYKLLGLSLNKLNVLDNGIILKNLAHLEYENLRREIEERNLLSLIEKLHKLEKRIYIIYKNASLIDLSYEQLHDLLSEQVCIDANWKKNEIRYRQFYQLLNALRAPTSP